MEQHSKALKILVNKLEDFAEAERFCELHSKVFPSASCTTITLVTSHAPFSHALACASPTHAHSGTRFTHIPSHALRTLMYARTNLLIENILIIWETNTIFVVLRLLLGVKCSGLPPPLPPFVIIAVLL